MELDLWDKFREAMSWLHIWAGVVLGALLFAIFWMGTLSVFDREIDRWMMPDTRLALPSVSVSLDRALERIADIVPEGTRRWDIRPPSEREPVLWFRYRPAQGGVAFTNSIRQPEKFWPIRVAWREEISSSRFILTFICAGTGLVTGWSGWPV